MSRLDSFIRRLTAQRDILNHISETMMDGPDGAVLEIGLGNGRTYSHLREHFPGRRIIAFDRAIGSHASSTPEAEDLVIGEIRETAQAFVGTEAALVHADIGTGYPDKDAVTLTWLPQLAAGSLRSGGIAVSGLPLEHPDLEPQPLPATVREDRYFLYRKR